ncbi:MAG: glycosyltransferase family A protein [Acidobacteriota bacterium]
MKLALVWIDGGGGSTRPRPRGDGFAVAERSTSDPSAVSDAVERALSGSSLENPGLVVTWDVRLGEPDAAAIRQLAAGRSARADVWHAGLRLGQAARPPLFDAVHPSWMLAHDPPSDVEATSWRLSLRAAVFRAEVWRELGGLDSGYAELDGAALELGHRWLWGGAVLRHVPTLLGESSSFKAPATPADDNLRFLVQRTGRVWATNATVRGLIARRAPAGALGALWRHRNDRALPQHHLPDRVEGATSTDDGEEPAPTVTVLIPTLDRYPYLDVVLEQLARQTVPVLEVLVVDQTVEARRRKRWAAPPGLDLRVFERDRPGQSSARNAGLVAARGEVILFLDDDVEMTDDLVERHLEVLRTTGADASCGGQDEVGAGDVPPEFRHPRISDVFPTCNAALRRSALERSGLFDLAFDHGARADADLGTRLYLSGALLRLSPAVSVLHHKAPAGGLRQHKARVATYAASRRSLVRHLPSVTELYLAARYGGDRALTEVRWQRALGTLKAGGPIRRRLAKLAWGLLSLPDTCVRIAARSRRARSMLRDYPQIPRFRETPAREPTKPTEAKTP